MRCFIVISDDIHLELLEVLELYCELLTARFGMLDQKYVVRLYLALTKTFDQHMNSTREPDPSVAEATCGVIFAAQRTELKGPRSAEPMAFARRD